MLSETCYNHSRQVERDLYLKIISPSDIFPTENCFGWTYFESAFILSIVQIVLAFLSSFLAGYILITVRVRSRFTILQIEIKSQTAYQIRTFWLITDLRISNPYISSQAQSNENS